MNLISREKVRKKLRKKTGKLQIRASVCFSTDNLFYVAEMLLLYFYICDFLLHFKFLDELEVKQDILLYRSIKSQKLAQRINFKEEKVRNLAELAL